MSTGPTGPTGPGINATSYQLEALEYFLKRDAGNRVKTDTRAAPITMYNELYYTWTTVTGDNVWLDQTILRQGPTIAAPAKVVTLVNPIKMTSIHGIGQGPGSIPALAGIAWKSGVTGWVSDIYDEDYKPVFYIAPQSYNSFIAPPSVFKEIGSSRYTPFIFDFNSGILTFLSSPSNLNYDITTTQPDGLGNTITSYNVWVTCNWEEDI
jgi:hypothetical protein